MAAGAIFALMQLLQDYLLERDRIPSCGRFAPSLHRISPPSVVGILRTLRSLDFWIGRAAICTPVRLTRKRHRFSPTHCHYEKRHSALSILIRRQA